MASYTFTYTLITHNHYMHNGKDVVTNADVRISGTRTDDDSSTHDFSFDTGICWSIESGDWVVQRTEPDGTRTAKTGFTDYSSLNIPTDIENWVKAHFENDATRLDGLKSVADSLIGE